MSRAPKSALPAQAGNPGLALHCAVGLGALHARSAHRLSGAGDRAWKTSGDVMEKDELFWSLDAMASSLIAMASDLLAMASNLLGMASNLVAMLFGQTQMFCCCRFL